MTYLVYMAKPLIVITLILYFLSANKGSCKCQLKKWIVLALIFSWVGDVVIDV